MEPSDAELARLVMAGSEEAARVLVTRHAGGAIGLAWRLVGDRAVAEELAQEAFARAFARLETYDAGYPFAPWFFRILHHVTIDHLRRKRLPSVALDALPDGGDGAAFASGPSPEEAAGRAEQTEALDGALRELRPEYREAVLLHYREEIPVQQVADVMQVPVGTVKTYLHRARKELARLLGARGWGPEGHR